MISREDIEDRLSTIFFLKVGSEKIAEREDNDFESGAGRSNKNDKRIRRIYQRSETYSVEFS